MAVWIVVLANRTERSWEVLLIGNDVIIFEWNVRLKT